MKRSSGILLPVFSLPSQHGIGTLGREARCFIDFLSDSGQSWWQVLPLGQTSYGDSPYQSLSTFAGNPYYIDLELLLLEDLITEDELSSFDFGNDPEKVDYSKLFENRFQLLHIAFERAWEKDAAGIEVFKQENAEWLPDYALYMAVKKHFGMRSWLDWEDAGIRLRRPESIEKYSKLLSEDINFYTYLQYLFFKQWRALRDYAKEKSVRIMGDLPIYVALDSADVWAQPELFQLDADNLPVLVSGVPPDYFNEEGQLWGNPLYNYERMAKDGYKWWIRRVGGAEKLYDAIRIDHFRGFDQYWAVPYGAASAKEGHWEKGPGMSLVGVLRDWFSGLVFIAEDLGESSPGLMQLLAESGFPGMKVLEFAFNGEPDNPYLPHMHEKHSACYIGTHDNEPLAAWKENATDEADVRRAAEYLGLGSEADLCEAMLRTGMSSVSMLFIAQMQDWLELGGGSRINIPGTTTGNWTWRASKEAFTKALSMRIHSLTELYGRL